MLADRLDESLLLFKNAYGWSTSDMVYVSLKVQTYAKAADSTKKRPSSSPPAGTNRSGDDAAPPPSSSAPPPPPDVLRSLGRLTALQQLKLKANSFTGSLPTQLGALAAATLLTLDWNEELSGTLPTQLGSMLTLPFSEWQSSPNEPCCQAAAGSGLLLTR